MTTTRVAIAAFDRIRPFHLSVPCAVFGEAAGAARRCSTCAYARPSRASCAAGSASASAPVMGCASWRGRHRGGAIVARRTRAGAGRLAGRAAPRAPARRADRRTLPGRVRAGRGGSARRSPGHDALALERAVRGQRFPRSASIPTCSTSMRATCSPRPAPRPGSTAACTCCVASSARRRPTASRARWWCRRIARAARRNTSSSRCWPRPCRPAVGNARVGRPSPGYAT